MSLLFGPLRQMGYVVRDIEAAMRHWVDVCGVGPWFYADRLPLTRFAYRGARHDGIHVSVALANSGETQLELIQQRCETPSMYRDFLAAGHEGLQHWSSWPEDYDLLYQRALANGYAVGQEGDSPRGRFVYFAGEGHPGTVIEMAHLTPARRRIFDQIRAAAQDWDGDRPHPPPVADVSDLLTIPHARCGWRRELDPPDRHLPAAAPRRRDRLAEHVLEGETAPPLDEVPAARVDLAHEDRIAEDVNRLLQPLVLGMVDQYRRRLPFASHDDLLFATLDSRHQLGETGLHGGYGKDPGH